MSAYPRDLFDDSGDTIPGLAPGMVLKERYRIGRSPLGSGGMGVVYLATDLILDIHVAVKVLPQVLIASPAAVKGLKEEAKIALDLSHPNIVRLHTFEEAGALGFLVMEYVNGFSLEEVLTARAELGEEEVLALVPQLCAGLGYAHDRKILHRDIKPGNIMLHFEGEPSEDEKRRIIKKRLTEYPPFTVKITDFGIARRAHDSFTHLTGRSTSGTLIYMSPEQLNGEKLDRRADIYSLGATLYHLLNGSPPFHSGDISYQIMHKEAEEIGQISKRLNGVILKGLSKKKEERYGSCAELCSAVRGEKVPVRPEKPEEAVKAEPREAEYRPPLKKRYPTRPAIFFIALLASCIYLSVWGYDLYLQSQRRKLEESERRRREDVERTQIDAAQRKTEQPISVVEGLKRLNANIVKGGTANLVVPEGLADLSKGYYEWNGKRYPREVKTEKAGVEMVLIEPGEFMMGSPETEGEGAVSSPSTTASSRCVDEGPQHRVKIGKPFYLGKYEVTQGQYEAVMGNNPSSFKGEDNPVEQVSWNDAKEFCRKVGGGARLPTEAEWEYACRAGTTTPFSFGGTISTDQANYDGNYTYGSGVKGVYREKTTPVGSFPANAWGLYDMHGNVWEWCEDVYHDNYEGAPTDGSAWVTGGDQSRRVLRGGSWNNAPRHLRSANRIRNFAGLRDINDGFRLAWTP